MRRYREDGERIVRLQSGIYVRRPQAERVGLESVTAGELVRLTLFVLFVFAAIAYAGPIVLEGLL